jgi:hypothetical protein
VERSFVHENEISRKRLRGLVESLTESDMNQPLGQHWTVAIGLAHLAFWDRQWLFKFQEWERTGKVLIPDVAHQRDLFSALNDGMLPWWRAIAPEQIRFEVLAAAEAADEQATKLRDSVVEAILTKRPRTLIRAVHRNDHLSEIEACLSK